MRVLIIEDAQVGQLLSTILERDGHEPMLAQDATEGRRRLTGPVPPDLLILDRMLPDADGADLLAGLRPDARTAELPVLLLTAAARASRHLDDGVLTRVLPKPFELAELRRALADLTTQCPRLRHR